MKLTATSRNKNLIIRRLTELTGKTAQYTGAPDFSYDIGNWRILRDNTVIVQDEAADERILETLAREGLITDPYASIPAEVGNLSAPSSTDAAWKGFDAPIRIQQRVIEVRTMINLINMIASKGDLLSKAVGKPGAFWVSDNVLFDLTYAKPGSFYALQHVLRVTDRAGLLKGLEFEINAVTFTGFPVTDDIVVHTAYEKLAAGIFQYCDGKKLTCSRRLATDNEKYSFRVWLTHLGLGGPENKTIRTILMRNLSGNGSFRTREQMAAYELRRQELRQRGRKAE